MRPPVSTWPVRISIFLWTLGTAVSQQTWKVQCNGGPGVNFTDLPQAVAAASPGDTILVYGTLTTCPGVSYYTAPIINKPLHIVGLNTFGAPGNSTPTFAILNGVIRVQNIPAGQQVTISNILVTRTFPVAPAGIEITNCQGAVVVEDLYYDSLGIAGTVMRVNQSTNVVFRGCQLAMGGNALEVTDSNVLLTTTFISHFPPWPGQNAYTQTTEGLNLVRSTATLVGSDVRGCSLMNPALSAMSARRAVLLDNSTLRIGHASIVVGGVTGSSPTQYLASYGIAPPPSVSAVHRDPHSTMAALPVPSIVISTIIPAAYHSWVVAGENYGVTVGGHNDGFALLLLGDLNPLPTPTPFGPIAIDPMTATFVDLVTTPAPGGFHQWTFHCPTSAPNGYAFAFQALTLSPSGTIGFSEPSPLTVGWQHGRIP